MRTTGSEPNPICVQKPIHPRRQNAFAGLPALDNANVFSSCRSMTRLPLPRFDIIARISRSYPLPPAHAFVPAFLGNSHGGKTCMPVTTIQYEGWVVKVDDQRTVPTWLIDRLVTEAWYVRLT